MKKVFVHRILDEKYVSSFISLMNGVTGQDRLFQDFDFFKLTKELLLVKNPSDADFFLVPHEYSFIKDNLDYINEIEFFSKKYDKNVVILSRGDIPYCVKIKRSIVIKNSGYKGELKKNEIIAPPFVENLGEKYGVVLKEKKNELPIVSFMGWVDLGSLKSQVKYLVKNFFTFGPKKKGLYFRKKVIKKLEKSEEIKTDFKIRNSFSGHKKTVEGNPQIIREEYVELLKESDLPLVVRGDGNYSLRFFEALSLGKIPLFIDTKTPLPLEDEIDYDSFILRVDYKDIDKIENRISEFWLQISNEEYVLMQEKAVSVFNEKLSPVAFYSYLFNNLEKYS